MRSPNIPSAAVFALFGVLASSPLSAAPRKAAPPPKVEQSAAKAKEAAPAQENKQPAASFKPDDCLSVPLTRPEEVVAKCTEVIKARGLSDGSAKHVQYRVHLIRALSALGRYTEALGNVEAAIGAAQHQEAAEPLIERGIIQNRLENYSSAIVDFNEAIKLGAGKQISGRAYYNMAISFEMLGKPDAAKKQMMAGRIMAPQQYATAMREYSSFRKAQEERKRYVKQYYDSGITALGMNSYDRAVVFFQLAASSDTTNLEYQSWIGSVYVDVKNYDKALSYLQIPAPEDRWNYYIARCYMELGLFGEALQAFKLAAEDKPPKNRGVDVSSETAHYIAILNGYADEYQKGVAASKNRKYQEAMDHFAKAQGFISTDEVKTLLESQKKMFAHAQAQEKSRKLKQVVLIVVSVLFFVFLNIIRNASAAQKRAAKKKRDQEFTELMERNPREAREAFVAFKESYPADAPALASVLKASMIKSGDARLIKDFAAELQPQEISEYALAAVQLLNGFRDFQHSLDALGLLDLIPYQQWGEKEIAAFCETHLIMDPVLLDPANIASQEGWNAAVPAAAYLALANQYLKMQDYDKAVKILEKNPKYTWEEDYWRSYIKCKLAVDQIRQINLADVPEALKLEMMEDMFKRGYSTEVNEYLLDEPRYKWKPEYYFYFIAITAQNKGVDDALEICRQFMEQVKPDKGSSKAYYIIGVLCEFMSRPEKAVAIYQGLADAGADCMDSDARLAALKVSHRPAPSAEEILAQVMPAGYQFRKK